MAQYDPLELAAYLRRARDPISGFQPSFTDQDVSGPYSFDVRSPEEVALGKHIDPVTGLPVGEEVPTARSAILDSISTLKDLNEYTTTKDLDQHELELKRLQRDLIETTRKEVEDTRGVTQARTALANYAALANGPGDTIYQQLEQQLALKERAASIDFSITKEGGLRGTRAQDFKAFDDRFKQIELRRELLAKDEKLAEDLKKSELLTEQNRRLQKGYNAEDRAVEDDRLSRATTSKLFGWNSVTHDKVETFLGKKIDPFTAGSMSTEEAQLYKYASEGQLYNDFTALAAKDTKLIDTFVDVSKKLKADPDEIQRIENVAMKYKAALAPIDSMTDRDLIAKTKGPEQQRVSIIDPEVDPKRYKTAVDTLRYQTKLQALQDVKNTYAASQMTVDSMDLTNRPDMGIAAKESANLVLRLLKERTGINNLAVMANEPNALDYIRTQLVVDYYNASHSLNMRILPLSQLWNTMLEEVTNRVNEKGKPFGLVVGYKTDPLILALRANTPREPRTMGNMSTVP